MGNVKWKQLTHTDEKQKCSGPAPADGQPHDES